MWSKCCRVGSTFAWLVVVVSYLAPVSSRGLSVWSVGAPFPWPCGVDASAHRLSLGRGGTLSLSVRLGSRCFPTVPSSLAPVGSGSRCVLEGRVEWRIQVVWYRIGGMVQREGEAGVLGGWQGNSCPLLGLVSRGWKEEAWWDKEGWKPRRCRSSG